jgi:hypothetical protein
MSVRYHRIGLYVVLATVTVVVVAPLLAIAYFATADGAENLAVGTVAAWAEPARDLAGGLVTFASPDRVYATYTQVTALAFPAVVLTAFAARALRPAPSKRSERIGWGITLTGYSLFGAGLLVEAVVLLAGDTSVALADVVFMAAMLPGLLLSLIGATVLGIVFLRSGYRPRVTAWLLALALPLWIVGSFVLGHNGIGLVPQFIAWAATGRQWRTADGPYHASDERAAPDLRRAHG